MARIDYAHGSIADKTYPVMAARIYGGEIRVGGDNGYGDTVRSISLYTGFAGCPAQYNVTTDRCTIRAHATGLY